MNEKHVSNLLKHAELNSHQYENLDRILARLKHAKSIEEVNELQKDVIRELDYTRFLIEETQKCIDDAK